MAQDELGGVVGEVGRVAVAGEESADVATECCPDGFALRPIESWHSLENLGEFAGHEAEGVGLLFFVE